MSMDSKKTTEEQANINSESETLWNVLLPVWKQEKGPDDQTLIDACRDSLFINMGLAVWFCRQAVLEGRCLNEVGAKGLMTLVSFYDSIVEPEEAMELEMPDELSLAADFLVLLTAALIQMPLYGLDALMIYLSIDSMMIQLLTEEWFV